MQPFNGKTEDIDTCLQFFEQQCQLQKIPISDWKSELFKLVKDDARKAIMTIHNYAELTYEDIKMKLLKYFNKTEHYRHRFHELKMSNKEQPQQFIDLVMSDLKSWLMMAEVDISKPTEILEMMVVDKVLNMCTREVFSFIKQRNVKTVKDLIKVLSDYKDCYPNDEISISDICASIDKFKPRNETYKLKNDIYKPRYMSQSKDNNVYFERRICHYCKRKGHILKFCYLRKKELEQHRPEKLHLRQNRNRPELNSTQKSQIIFHPAIVNGQQIKCLRDSGCTTVVVKRSLVNKDQYMSKKTHIKLGDGTIKSCDVATIKIDSPWLAGICEAIILDNPVCDLIIGNLPGVMKFFGDIGVSYPLLLNRCVFEEEKQMQKETE
ncbi:hypothetical protein Btru_074973 [Bulinus truncatus]|nr:hypothetical protein Btru_074973 [Bulinus truncatus]